MKRKLTAPSWAWSGVLLGALVLAACGVAPEEEVSGAEDALSALHDDDGPRPLPTWSEPTFASNPSMATDGKQFFVAWLDGGRPGGLFAARVSREGRLLDPDAIALNPEPRVFPTAPAAAYDGKHFLVVWRDETSLYLVRVRRDGTLDGPRVTLFTPTDHFPAGTPGIACSQRRCLVAWFTFGGAAGSGAIRGLTLKTDCKDLGVREVPISTSLTGINSFGLSVAWAHERYLVTWTDVRHGSQDILAARVRCDGTVLDPDSFSISRAPGEQRFPDVVGTKGGFFVAWSDSRRGAPDIFGARVKDGTARVLEPEGIPIATSATADILPRIASEGHDVLVTWSSLMGDTARVRAARVERDGEVREPDGFALSEGTLPREVDSDVACSNGRYFAVYGRAPVLDEPPWQVLVGTRVKRGEVVDSPRIRISHSPAVEETAP